MIWLVRDRRGTWDDRSSPTCRGSRTSRHPRDRRRRPPDVVALGRAANGTLEKRFRAYVGQFTTPRRCSRSSGQTRGETGPHRAHRRTDIGDEQTRARVGEDRTRAPPVFHPRFRGTANRSRRVAARQEHDDTLGGQFADTMGDPGAAGGDAVPRAAPERRCTSASCSPKSEPPVALHEPGEVGPARRV